MALKLSNKKNMSVKKNQSATKHTQKMTVKFVKRQNGEIEIDLKSIVKEVFTQSNLDSKDYSFILKLGDKREMGWGRNFDNMSVILEPGLKMYQIK